MIGIDAIETFAVKRSARQPLLDFMVAALEEAGCQMIRVPAADTAPFAISFVLPTGERMGIVAYAFFANSRQTKNRPDDEHRFQLKYGSKDGRLHELWQDPFGLYTTLLVGIDTERQIFVGADPVLHSPTRLFISIEFKRHHVDEILRSGWHAWERERRALAHEERAEVLVGGTRRNFLRYVLFEREARGEDQGHRQWLGERLASDPGHVSLLAAGVSTPDRLHELARELCLDEREILSLLGGAPRLKMAVRGWVAEEHLARTLREVRGVRTAERVEGQGDVDVHVELRSGASLGVQCKNVLRARSADGLARLDFQRTRTSKSDPCSRYYSPRDFDLVAACMHAVTDRWEFRFAPTHRLDVHPRCSGKLASNVRIDARWSAEPAELFQALT